MQLLQKRGCSTFGADLAIMKNLRVAKHAFEILLPGTTQLPRARL